MDIKPLETHLWNDVKRIYEEGITTRSATFETSAPSWDTWSSSHLNNCRFIALDGDVLTGWAALTPVSERCVYAGVVDISIYMFDAFRGKKIGNK